MTLCVALDGWHEGEAVYLAMAPPTLRLYRPMVTTVCSCDPDAACEEFTAPHAVDELKLAFRSLDGEVALYSTDGKSGHILNRTWVARRDMGAFYPKGKILYVGCHDHRAWPQESEGGEGG